MLLRKIEASSGVFVEVKCRFLTKTSLDLNFPNLAIQGVENRLVHFLPYNQFHGERSDRLSILLNKSNHCVLCRVAAEFSKLYGTIPNLENSSKNIYWSRIFHNNVCISHGGRVYIL